jgi:hypothetical protein
MRVLSTLPPTVLPRTLLPEVSTISAAQYSLQSGSLRLARAIALGQCVRWDQALQRT